MKLSGNSWNEAVRSLPPRGRRLLLWSRTLALLLLIGALSASSMFAEAPALQPAPATPEEEAKKIRIPLFEETMPIWAKVGKYDVELQVVGERTQEVIKIVGSFAGLNEKFVARMLEDLPATVLRRANDERALQAKKDLEAVGATVKLVEKKIPDRSHAPAKPAGSGSAQKMHPPGGPAGSATSRQAPVKSPPPAPGAK